ncbi:hypothetical protein EC917_12459 [Bacillus thuringiensis]|uniref:Uncharacterized protein n=1 Tax=Bacillus thuringiensis TaxID=1428 RepID=A0A4R4B4N3_BACTU|nr:hypothetical protein EC917_12459 [Bacillus thuringiensis]TCW47743.1 hypothetical protein EC910_12359 [Bacillus thuringiensis]
MKKWISVLLVASFIPSVLILNLESKKKCNKYIEIKRDKL